MVEIYTSNFIENVTVMRSNFLHAMCEFIYTYFAFWILYYCVKCFCNGCLWSNVYHFKKSMNGNNNKI